MAVRNKTTKRSQLILLLGMVDDSPKQSNDMPKIFAAPLAIEQAATLSSKSKLRTKKAFTFILE